MNLFLESFTFPQLTSDQVNFLEAPLTTNEIVTAFARFARSKSLGSDGLPIEFYSQFNEILTLKLLALYNHPFETLTLPPFMREATIVLIPKPGKDPGYSESYRPISLLQVDIKILSIHLNQAILSLTHADQAGFMPSCNI